MEICENELTCYCCCRKYFHSRVSININKVYGAFRSFLAKARKSKKVQHCINLSAQQSLYNENIFSLAELSVRPVVCCFHHAKNPQTAFFIDDIWRLLVLTSSCKDTNKIKQRISNLNKIHHQVLSQILKLFRALSHRFYSATKNLHIISTMNIFLAFSFSTYKLILTRVFPKITLR